jgi:hypothetical protein
VTARRLTVVLLLACLAIPAFMYLRDTGTSPERTAGQASFDAGRMLAQIFPDCGSRCSVETLGQSASDTWRLRLATGTWHACYDLDPGTFRYSPAHGFSGVKTAPCRLG